MNDIRYTTTIKLLKKTQYWHGDAQSDSMAPLINEGDVIFFQCVTQTHISCNDIVAFIGEQEKIKVHRIIRIEKTQIPWRITTKGDSLKIYDTPWPFSHMLGKAVAINGRYGKISLTTHRHWIFPHLYKLPYGHFIGHILLFVQMKTHIPFI